ncbi:MAG: AMP-binding protein [Candidatus Eisenbacteria bacterium]
MPLDFLRKVFSEFPQEAAVIHQAEAVSFAGLSGRMEAIRSRLVQQGVPRGAVVAIESGYSPDAIAMLLALIEYGAIAVPLAPPVGPTRGALLQLGQVEYRSSFDLSGVLRIERTDIAAGHQLYKALRSEGHPGLTLFTSGSSGEPKAVVHDMTRLLRKYHVRRHRLRTMLFLLFDHIGGLDTLFQSLSNACTSVIPRDRTPESVAATIERHQVQVLPSSPSFLTMLLLSGANLRHDLSSLRYITYGAEVMPASTLGLLARAFPTVKLMQKYGLTELGTLRSQSQANDSLLVRIGGEGFETRIVDGILQVRAESSMLGYLNAPSPFTEDGWFITGDMVEQQGEFLRIQGRASDLINVGGQKVHPSEVESVIHELDNISEVAVSGRPHPFMGQVVIARIVLVSPEDARELEQRVRQHCRTRLKPYQVPVQVVLTEGLLHTERDKVTRR